MLNIPSWLLTLARTSNSEWKITHRLEQVKRWGCWDCSRWEAELCNRGNPRRGHTRNQREVWGGRGQTALPPLCPFSQVPDSRESGVVRCSHKNIFLTRTRWYGDLLSPSWMTSKATGTGNTQGRLAWNSILSKWNRMEREGTVDSWFKLWLKASVQDSLFSLPIKGDLRWTMSTKCRKC